MENVNKFASKIVPGYDQEKNKLRHINKHMLDIISSPSQSESSIGKKNANGFRPRFKLNDIESLDKKGTGKDA